MRPNSLVEESRLGLKHGDDHDNIETLNQRLLVTKPSRHLRSSVIVVVSIVISIAGYSDSWDTNLLA
ncbi:MAG: hypothetical protein AAB968_02985 [Patescibacteria group bacterium]